MAVPALLDNDVIFKVCCFGVGDELISCASVDGTPPAALQVAQYVVRDLVSRSPQLKDREAAAQAFFNLRSKMGTIEPNEEEVRVAAAFEADAQVRNLELDSGESLLLAILLRRDSKLMLTGDKRAIRAIEQFAGGEVSSPRVACFEQLIASILRKTNAGNLRDKICRERGADRTLSICFACESPSVPTESIFDCLRSYTNDLRAVAQRVLLPTDDLSFCIP
jgi:hypothetical protein